MRSIVTKLSLALILGALGALYTVESGSAAYGSKSITCGNRTCSGSTTFGISANSYVARGQSSTSAVTAQFFAWTRGTNQYHIGTWLDQQACQVQNGTSCTTPWLYLCDTLPQPAGCGSWPGTGWYATTYSWFKPSTTEYAIFTGTRAGVDNSYCWNNATCP